MIAGELRVPLSPNQEVERVWNLLKGTDLITNQLTVIGTTASPLNGARADARSRETNLGRLATDSILWFNAFDIHRLSGFMAAEQQASGLGKREHDDVYRFR